MYERYWGLNGSPFQGQHDLRWFVETPVHEEALARLSFVIEQRRRLGFLSGPDGTGKSLVLRAVRKEAERLGREVAFVDLLGLDQHELLWQLAVAMRLGPQDNVTRWWLRQAVSDHIQSLQMARLPLVLIFDHLDRAELECSSLIERLLHVEGANGWLTIISAARDSFDASSVPELFRHSDLRIELPRLNRQETAMFVGELLGKAGCRREVFGVQALRTLFDLSNGEPRAILRLCDLALAADAHQGRSVIDSASLRAAAGELPVVPSPHYSFTDILAASR